MLVLIPQITEMPSSKGLVEMHEMFMCYAAVIKKRKNKRLKVTLLFEDKRVM